MDMVMMTMFLETTMGNGHNETYAGRDIGLIAIEFKHFLLRIKVSLHHS